MILTSQFRWDGKEGSAGEHGVATRADKRNQIMQAAEKLFTSRRFHEVTLDLVAQKARVGKGTIYRYFRDKDDLFFQVATAGFDDICALIRREVSPGAPFERQLLGAAAAIGRFFEKRRQLMRMMQAEEGRMPWCHGPHRKHWLAQRRKLRAAVAGILAQGIEEGKLRNDLPANILAALFLGILRTQAHDLDEAPPALRHYEVAVRLFLDGAGRRA